MHPVKGKFRPGLVTTLVLIHLVAFYGVWWSLTWGVTLMAWVLAIFLFIVGTLGITVGYHRYFTHGAYYCAREVEYATSFSGAFAGQGSISDWRPNHLQHHAFADTEYDPHSPLEYRDLPAPLNRIIGFLWAHVGWLFWETVRPQGYNPGIPVHIRTVLAWQDRYYWHIVISGYVVPFILAGWSGLFLAGFIRSVLTYHVTWMTNSVGHTWGPRPIGPDGKVRSKDESRNNLFVAFLNMGEGYRGNHHEQPNSAELGYRWYHWDPGKWVILLLGMVGLTYKIQRFNRM